LRFRHSALLEKIDERGVPAVLNRKGPEHVAMLPIQRADHEDPRLCRLPAEIFSCRRDRREA
jgi:hypothetical protein